MHVRDFANLLSTVPMQAPDSAPGAAAPAASPPAATPSPAPAPSSDSGGAPAPSTPAAESASSFSEMGFDDFESVEIPEAPPAASPAPAAADPAAPATPTPAPAAPAADPAAAPAEPTQSPAAPASTPASPVSELDSLLQTIEGDSAKQLVDHLAATAFKLSKEDADALELDAVNVIPRLMAKVQVMAMKNTLNMMKTLLPKLISSQVETTTAKASRAQEAMAEFYATNKDLNPQAHAAAVSRWASAFRAQNPKASRAEAIKFVGNAIRAELGMPPLAAGGAPSAPARPAPFAPARGGAGAQVVVPETENAFAGLGMDFD